MSGVIMSPIIVAVIPAFLFGLYSGWELHRKYLRKLFKISLTIRKKLHGG